MDLECGFCGRSFQRMACELGRGRGQYCSKRCRTDATLRRLLLVCARCGAAFQRKRTEVSDPGRSYCRRSCYDAARPPSATSYVKRGVRHEHRIVAERMLGRPLRPGEVVHHVDGDRHNNAPDNLEVLPSQAEHARHHFAGKPHSPEHRRKLAEHLNRVRHYGPRR